MQTFRMFLRLPSPNCLYYDVLCFYLSLFIIMFEKCFNNKVIVMFQDTGEPGWWRGEIGGKEGVFPDNFVAVMSDEDKEVR